MVALLLASVPLAVLGAVTFSDLGSAGPEFRPSIQAIADAGITIGADAPNSADPNVRLYNPKGNPPVANTATAQTARALLSGAATAGQVLTANSTYRYFVDFG